MSTLSVTFIARNEEQNLPRALASVAKAADEIIVTDTGSTDATIEIARRFGARVAHFDWIDDFAAAHNYCNSLAQCDWIFMLDADEELLPESRDELRRLLDDERALAYGVIRQDLTDANRPDRYTEMWQLRLVRNRPELRFAGRFHHHFEPALSAVARQAGLEVRPSNVRIRHWGYLAGLRREKSLRAARLLELELADRPGQFYYLVELGLTRLALDDERGRESLAEAAQLAAIGRLDWERDAGPLAMLLEFVLAQPRSIAGFPLDWAAARRLALEHFPHTPPLLWQIARAEFGRGRFAQAATLLDKIIELGATGGYDRQVSFDPAILYEDALLNLGVCCVRLGRRRDAQRCFRRLLGNARRGKEAAENLRAIGGR